jgi:hypothetical protein
VQAIAQEFDLGAETSDDLCPEYLEVVDEEALVDDSAALLGREPLAQFGDLCCEIPRALRLGCQLRRERSLAGLSRLRSPRLPRGLSACGGRLRTSRP